MKRAGEALFLDTFIEYLAGYNVIEVCPPAIFFLFVMWCNNINRNKTKREKVFKITETLRLRTECFKSTYYCLKRSPDLFTFIFLWYGHIVYKQNNGIFSSRIECKGYVPY